MSIFRPEKKKVAVALRYHSELDRAPRVSAKGRAEFAERMLKVAEKHGISVYNDPDLAAALSALKSGDEISPELYGAVAQVIAYVYGLAQK